MRKFITYTDRVVNVHFPHVVVETAVARGAKRASLFENTELTPEMLTSPDMRISHLEFATLIRNALRLTGDPALGIHVGRNTGIAQMGVVGFLLQNCPTLGAALEAALRYSRSVAPAWEFTLERQDDRAALVFQETIPMMDLRRFSHEVILGAYDVQSRSLHGEKPLPVQKVELPYEEPAHLAEYRAMYDVPFVFERPTARIWFDGSVLDETIAFSDPATAKLAEQFCAQLLPPDPAEEGLVSRMRRILEGRLATPPDLTELARTLQTSTRTLRRELRRMGTSYTELLDEVRRVRAEAWVQTNSMSVERLAAGLGFSSPGSFRRAFKRWTGRTPSESRTRV